MINSLKICKQIDYYFSDFNLQNDRFMRSLISDDNSSVPIDILFTFNVLKNLLSKEKEKNDDDEILAEIFKNYKFKNVEYKIETKSFKRLIIFKYKKRDLRQIYKNKLLLITNLLNQIQTDNILIIYEWFKNILINDNDGNIFDMDNILGMRVNKRNNNNNDDINSSSNNISSIFIAFKNIDIIDEFCKKISSKNLTIYSYKDYLKFKLLKKQLKNKEKRSSFKSITTTTTTSKSTTTTTITTTYESESESTSTTTSESIKEKKFKKFKKRIIKKTIILLNDNDNFLFHLMKKCIQLKYDENNYNKFIEMKQYLFRKIGLTFIYYKNFDAIYLFFKNIEFTLKFYNYFINNNNEQQDDLLKIFQNNLFINNNGDDINNNNEDVNMINIDLENIRNKIFLIKNDDDIPGRFNNYIYCIRRYYQN